MFKFNLKLVIAIVAVASGLLHTQGSLAGDRFNSPEQLTIKPSLIREIGYREISDSDAAGASLMVNGATVLGMWGSSQVRAAVYPRILLLIHMMKNRSISIPNNFYDRLNFSLKSVEGFYPLDWMGAGMVTGLATYIAIKLFSGTVSTTSFVTRKFLRNLGWRGQEFLQFLLDADQKCENRGGTLDEGRTLNALYNSVYYYKATSDVWCKAKASVPSVSGASASKVVSSTSGAPSNNQSVSAK